MRHLSVCMIAAGAICFLPFSTAPAGADPAGQQFICFIDTVDGGSTEVYQVPAATAQEAARKLAGSIPPRNDYPRCTPAPPRS